MKTPNTKTILYDAQYKNDFRDLNLEWIEKYFRVEPKDLEQVNNPEACLASGGQIFFILLGDLVAGTCAMYKIAPHKYELAKMAVRPSCQGLGLGDVLMESAEAWALEQGAEEVLMLSNTVLVPAISLYQKHGYKISHLGQHPDYERCNIELKKELTKGGRL